MGRSLLLPVYAGLVSITPTIWDGEEGEEEERRRTPRLISTMDQMIIGWLSVYVRRFLIVKTRMIWMIVTKKPRPKRAARKIYTVEEYQLAYSHLCKVIE